MNTYLKNKKLFLLLFFLLLFIPFKVDALVLKNVVDISSTDSYTSGTMSTSSINYFGRTDFDTPLNANDYDYDLIAFKLLRFNFTTTYNYQDNNTTWYCDNFKLNSTASTTGGDQEYYYYSLVCQNPTVGGNNVDTLVKGDITINGTLYSNSKTVSCWFDKSLGDNYLVCPLYKDTTYTHLILNATTNGYTSVSYNVQYSAQKFFFNYDSTEIVNGLLGVQTSISNTTTAIEQQTQQQAQQNAYVQNTSTTGAQTTTSTEITALSNELTQHMSQFSDLTQLVVAPITLFMELNNDVCVPLTLQVPFVGGTAVLPCIKPIMQQYFGGLYSVFTTVIATIICYWVFVKTVALIKSFLDADDDKIEVIDL